MVNVFLAAMRVLAYAEVMTLQYSLNGKNESENK